MLSRLTSKTWDPIILILTIVALGACVMAVGNGGGARRLFVTLKDGEIVRSCNHWINTSRPIPHRAPVRKLHISHCPILWRFGILMNFQHPEGTCMCQEPIEFPVRGTNGKIYRLWGSPIDMQTAGTRALE